MKARPFVALICCTFCITAMAQSADSSQKPINALKQTAFVLGEASSKIPPKETSSIGAGAKAVPKKQTGPGPLVLTRAADGTVSVKHEGDSSPVKEVQ